MSIHIASSHEQTNIDFVGEDFTLDQLILNFLSQKYKYVY